MSTGAITSYIDVAQLVLYAFWIFFIGLILYLRREDRREGYPLDAGSSHAYENERLKGFAPLAEAKTFQLSNGVTATSGRPDTRDVAAVPAAKFPGAPLQPTGNPMLDAVGAAAYAERADVVDHTVHGEPKIVPMRVATDFTIAENDPDPRGMSVFGAYGKPAGVVKDVWVDRSEILIRYLEVEVAGTESPRNVLLPMALARIVPSRNAAPADGSIKERVVKGRRREVHVASILARHFADVPTIKNPDQVTLLEEDKICAYYGGGSRYADPSRMEPLL